VTEFKQETRTYCRNEAASCLTRRRYVFDDRGIEWAIAVNSAVFGRVPVRDEHRVPSGGGVKDIVAIAPARRW
jgi:hypothetical protein